MPLLAVDNAEFVISMKCAKNLFELVCDKGANETYYLILWRSCGHDTVSLKRGWRGYVRNNNPVVQIDF